ncbi:MAG: hypothetical protein KAS39_04275, partial [Actinomycetia bacterium]|nr:hypothetical protein [Actinomycetes bacterium]
TVSNSSINEIEDGKATKINVSSEATNGDLQAGNKSYLFTVYSIKFFANWYNGWTKGENEAYGKIIFTELGGNKWESSVVEPFELWETISGEIRFNSMYYTHEDGTKKVKNRITRIEAVADFLLENNIPKFFINTKSFKYYLRPLLFPEIYSMQIKNKRRDDPEYSFEKLITPDIPNISDLSNSYATNLIETEENTDLTNISDLSNSQVSNIAENEESKGNNLKEKENRERKHTLNSGVFWEKEYTKNYFPEYMHKLRDTGGLLRDFEEAPDLFFIFYNIDNFFNKELDSKTFELLKE